MVARRPAAAGTPVRWTRRSAVRTGCLRLRFEAAYFALATAARPARVVSLCIASAPRRAAVEKRERFPRSVVGCRVAHTALGGAHSGHQPSFLLGIGAHHTAQPFADDVARLVGIEVDQHRTAPAITRMIGIGRKVWVISTTSIALLLPSGAVRREGWTEWTSIGRISPLMPARGLGFLLSGSKPMSRSRVCPAG